MTICGACIVTDDQGSQEIICGSSVNKYFRKLHLLDYHTLLSTLLMALWFCVRSNFSAFCSSKRIFTNTGVFTDTHCLYVYIICLPILILSPVVEVRARVHSFLFHEVPIHWHCNKPCIRCTKLLSKYYLLLFVKLSFFLLYS